MTRLFYGDTVIRPKKLQVRPIVALLVLLGCTAAAAAPDEAALGAAEGYSSGTRETYFQRNHRVGAYSSMETIFPTRKVTAGDTARTLPQRDSKPDWPFIRNYLDSHPLTGLLVIHDGRVLFEHYQYSRRPEQRFTSWSMAKTIVAMAVGIAVEEGRIASIDDPVDRYEPALSTTAWKGVAIRHVLQMTSGVRFDETYDKPGTDIVKLSSQWSSQEGSMLQVLSGLNAVHAPPGEKFKYSSAETQVLAQVLARATGRPLAEYVSEKLWMPMGAEADAAWVLDASGMEAAYCCMSARLRDWGRLGQLLLDGGKRDGKSVVPAAWVEAATTVRFRDGHLQPGRATPYYGYGYQTWIFPENLGFALLGIQGQSVFIHPRKRLVMVQTAVWPTSIDAELGRQRDAFWRELVFNVR